MSTDLEAINKMHDDALNKYYHDVDLFAYEFKGLVEGTNMLIKCGCDRSSTLERLLQNMNEHVKKLETIENEYRKKRNDFISAIEIDAETSSYGN